MRKRFFFLLGFIFQNYLIFAQENFSKIDSILRQNTSQNIFSGIVLVAKDNKIVFEKSYGFADFKTKKNFDSKTTFQIASISKQFTAFGIMLLEAQQKLQYDDKVAKYIPQFPYQTITIRHLLNHTSGLPEFWNKIRPQLNHKVSNGNSELLKYLITNKLPLESEPGFKLAYADIGYDLLAMIIENVSEMSYEKFMHKNIFQPSKMKSTKALMVTDIRKIGDANLARGHSYLADSNQIEYSHLLPSKDFVFYLGNFYGDGSVISSAKDLLKWDKVLTTNQLLPTKQMEAAFSPPKNPKDSLIYVDTAKTRFYGFGWVVAEYPKLGKIQSHSGGHPGFTSYFMRCPNKKLTMIFLNNFDSTPKSAQLRVDVLNMLATIYENQ